MVGKTYATTIQLRARSLRDPAVLTYDKYDVPTMLTPACAGPGFAPMPVETNISRSHPEIPPDSIVGSKTSGLVLRTEIVSAVPLWELAVLSSRATFSGFRTVPVSSRDRLGLRGIVCYSQVVPFKAAGWLSPLRSSLRPG